MKKSKLPSINISKLNKLIEQDKAICTIVYDGEHINVSYWQWLENGDDYADKDDESYQNSDGSYCGLVAYSDDSVYHYPYQNIEKIFVGYPINVNTK